MRVPLLVLFCAAALVAASALTSTAPEQIHTAYAGSDGFSIMCTPNKVHNVCLNSVIA
jgi:hypothetical protein